MFFTDRNQIKTWRKVRKCFTEKTKLRIKYYLIFRVLRQILSDLWMEAYFTKTIARSTLERKQFRNERLEIRLGCCFSHKSSHLCETVQFGQYPREKKEKKTDTLVIRQKLARVVDRHAVDLLSLANWFRENLSFPSNILSFLVSILRLLALLRNDSKYSFFIRFISSFFLSQFFD